MSFYAIEIEPTPGFGFTGGPEFNTNIQTLASGAESRNADWYICRHSYTVPYKNIPAEMYRRIKKVFLICRGRNHTFLHRDWGDFEAVDEPFGVGDGVTVAFQLSKLSSEGGGTYLRTITKPEAGVAIKNNGVVVGATVSSTDGSVVFAVAPVAGHVLTWTGTFLIQVRFDTDKLPYSLDDKGTTDYISNGSLNLIEVLGE